MAQRTHLVMSALAACAVSVIALPTLFAAAPTSIVFEGKIELPPGGVKEPAAAHTAFVERIPNAIAELRPYDPRPECFVALDGGPVAPDATAAPTIPVKWSLEGASFSPPILPVVVGSKIEIKNVGSTTHAIFAEGDPALFGAEPVGPGGVRNVTASVVGKAIVIHARNSPHVEARLVALPTRYFSRLKKDGSYSIPDVPAGKWNVKVWCKDGWTSSTKSVEVARGARGDLVLPERIDSAPAQ